MINSTRHVKYDGTHLEADMAGSQKPSWNGAAVAPVPQLWENECTVGIIEIGV